MLNDSIQSDKWERQYVIPPGYVARRDPDSPRNGVVLAPALPRNDPLAVDAFTVPPRPGGRDADD
jgi:hypothetical protein